MKRGFLNGAGVLNRKIDPATCVAADVPVYAVWQSIVARADSVWVHGDCVILTVATAKRMTPHPCSHDVLHAQVTEYVFAQQTQFGAKMRFDTWLLDVNGRRFPVPCRSDCVAKIIERALGHEKDGSRQPSPIPAPLVGFLAAQSCKGKDY